MAVYPPLPVIVISCIAIPSIAFFLGVIFYYEIRKLSARMQSRRGPWFLVPGPLRPLLGFSRLVQPLWDVLKLLYKETIIPETASKTLFKISPIFALGCLIAATLFVPIAGRSPFDQFEFSLVVVLYLIMAVPLALVTGGSASSSPWGGVGSRREAELMLAYEVPLIISIFSVAMMADSLSLAEIVRFQNVPIRIFLILNPFAALAALLSMVGMLHLKPFDIPEAEVELVAGPLTEYSGRLLGIWEMVRTFLIFISTTLYVDLFLGGGVIRDLLPTGLPSILATIIIFFVQSGIVAFAYTIVHTTNPRYRIDQSFTWYMKIPLASATLGLIWAYAVAHLMTFG
ncbi:MAG: complex I subunit 1 family protein [Candidatus Bathyarchaeia archaeon]